MKRFHFSKLKRDIVFKILQIKQEESNSYILTNYLIKYGVEIHSSVYQNGYYLQQKNHSVM